MAVPRVFVSSTFYDLRHIRESLRGLISDLGYIPVLSEEGSVYYDPAVNAADACLTEVGSCQLYVLIIGGRYGSPHDDDASVTRAEYRAAVQQKIPIFTLVEQSTLGDYRLYQRNADEEGVDADAIKFPGADDVRVFHFISEVGQATRNNAFHGFATYDHIESYLKAQWAGMFSSMLQARSESERVRDTLQAVEDISERIELFTSQILQSVGSPVAKAIAAMYTLLQHEGQVADDLAYVGVRVKPSTLLRHQDLDAAAEASGKEFHVLDEASNVDNILISSTGEIEAERYEETRALYDDLRARLEAIRIEADVTTEQIEAEEDAADRLSKTALSSPRTTRAQPLMMSELHDIVGPAAVIVQTAGDDRPWIVRLPVQQRLTKKQLRSLQRWSNRHGIDVDVDAEPVEIVGFPPAAPSPSRARGSRVSSE